MVSSTVNDDETEREEPVWICKHAACAYETDKAPTYRGTMRVLLKDDDVKLMAYASKDVVDLISQRPAEFWGEPGDAQRAAVRAAMDAWLRKPCSLSLAWSNGRYYLNGLHELQSSGPPAKRAKTT